MDTLLRKWIAGKPMAYGRAFSSLKPRHQGVWEMKSVDLRIFGWIYRPRVFVATFAELADDYDSRRMENPRRSSYDEARDRVVWIRERLDLDPPAYATGEYDALV